MRDKTGRFLSARMEKTARLDEGANKILGIRVLRDYSLILYLCSSSELSSGRKGEKGGCQEPPCVGQAFPPSPQSRGQCWPHLHGPWAPLMLLGWQPQKPLCLGAGSEREPGGLGWSLPRSLFRARQSHNSLLLQGKGRGGERGERPAVLATCCSEWAPKERRRRSLLRSRLVNTGTPAIKQGQDRRYTEAGMRECTAKEQTPESRQGGRAFRCLPEGGPAVTLSIP